ncbi:MAG: class I SAM-dependent methyltransferase [Streptosporangiaceae bacterium]
MRHGGDAAYRERLLAELLYPWRDEILGRVGIGPGGTLLDVGTGDGLIGFGALDRVGPGGHVIFSDISQDLLDHCRDAAAAEGALDRCSFVRAAADSLNGVGDASVDAVTTRSVLIYVKDKAAALREFYRVLRPGGRVSLFEPVNRLHAVPGRFDGYDIGPVSRLAAKVQAFYDGIQPPDSDPMLDFDDHDLVRHAEEAGFAEVHLDLRVDVESALEPCPWDRFLRRSGNPLEPPFGEVLDQVLDPAEAAAFTAHLRPLVESGSGQLRRAVAYLVAVKAPARVG